MSRDYSHRDFKSKEFEPLALGLGRAALAWNDLLVSLSGLFASVIPVRNQLIPNIIWYTVKSDRDQINMLGDLAISRAIGINLTDDIRNEIDWVRKQATGLIDTRNDLLHSPFRNSNGEIGPLHLGVHNRAKKFDGQDVVAICDWFVDTATLIRDYVDAIEQAISRPDSTLPARPQLLKRPKS